MLDNESALKEAGDKYNHGTDIILLLTDHPFYAEIARRVQHVKTRSVKTAQIGWNHKADSICLYYNPDFMIQNGKKARVGVLKHEYGHMIYGHLASRRRQPHGDWNVATDLAINSIIVTSDAPHAGYSNIGNPDAVLPETALIPGHPVFLADEKRAATDEEKLARKRWALIEKLPPMKSSEFYFQALQEVPEENQGDEGECPMCGGTGKIRIEKDPGEGDQEKDPNGDKDAGSGDDPNEDETPEEHFAPVGEIDCPCCNGKGHGSGGGLSPMDDHGFWDNVPDEAREYVANRIRGIIEKAVYAADQSSKGWGSIPAELQAEIRQSISSRVPWRSVLRQFIGVLLPGDRTTSIKRINRRYPYIHPGVKRGRKAKLLVAIDMSGSVGNEMLCQFFGELTNLARNCEIDVVPFDCIAEEEHIVRWKRGGPPPMGRVKCGGTSFDAPTNLFNDPRNRGRWDGLILVTDGQCSAPGPCRSRRGWVLGEGCKLAFDSSELQVFIDKSSPIVGAWR